MSIWEYKSQTKDTLHTVMCSVDCTHCGSNLYEYKPISDTMAWGATEVWRARTCQTCGWWKIARYFDDPEGNLSIVSRSAAAGSLKQLDLTNLDTPLNEVREFLAARYDSRFDLNPYLFEKTVASVFEDIGYEVLVTSRSGDDGIDVLLFKSNEVIGVQVKRYRERIKVSQIRELLGALVVNNLTKGMFVTTSQFQSGATKTVAKAANRGFEIELVDGLSFFDALRIVQRQNHTIHDIETLIKEADFTYISDSGVQYTGMHPEYKQDLIKSLRGPNGPIEEWP
jgi:restriction system protein